MRKYILIGVDDFGMIDTIGTYATKEEALKEMERRNSLIAEEGLDDLYWYHVKDVAAI